MLLIYDLNIYTHIKSSIDRGNHVDVEIIIYSIILIYTLSCLVSPDIRGDAGARGTQMARYKSQINIRQDLLLVRGSWHAHILSKHCAILVAC